MISPMVEAWLPTATLLLELVAGGAAVAVARRLFRGHRLLFFMAVLATFPPLYAGLTWAGVLTERYVRMERPQWTVPSSLVVLFVAHRLLRLSPSMNRWRRTLMELSTTGIALISALIVVGIDLGRPLDRLAILVAIDRSRSIDLVPGADARVAAELQIAESGMREDDRIGTIAFAAEAQVEDPLRPRTKLPAPQKVMLGRDGTDIGGALRRALAELPGDFAARIVVLSDGVATRGDPLEDAASAVAAGVPVDVVPLDQAPLANVRLVALRIPSHATQDEVLEFRLVTESSADTAVEVRIFKDGQPIRTGKAQIRRGEDLLSFREKAGSPGLHRFDAEISAVEPAADGAPEDNRAAAFVRVRGQAVALIMESDPAKASALASALENAAFLVKVVGPTGVPTDVAGFAAFDLVILSDIAASALSSSQIEALATSVRDLGGGLILMGGDRSLGPGGYGHTPIEEISPVSFDLKQERRRASLAEVIAIDISGSMAQMATPKNTKLDLANEAAVRSAELLGEGDHLGIMHVDTAVTWSVPLGPLGDRVELARRIRGVGPGGGGIYVDIALSNAYAALDKTKANLKHVLLFADGSDAEERSRAPGLVAGAKQRGITTTVVALGQGPDVPDLERLSRLGDGRFYLIEDASRLPAVFAQETILAARSAINEVPFLARPVGQAAAIRGIDFAQAPALTGYVVTLPKARAQVILRGPEEDPILTSWSVGLGRTAVFASDFKDRWGQAWTGWSGATKLFGQLARDMTRRSDDSRVRLAAETSGGKLRIRATTVDDDGSLESFRRLRIRVGGPDGFHAEAQLEASGVGAYEGVVPLSRPGAFMVTAVDELTQEPVATTGAVLTAGEELRPTGSDRGLLRRLAQFTHGQERDTLAGIFHDRVERRFAYRSLTPPLLLAAAFILLFSVGARRLSAPEWLARQCTVWLGHRHEKGTALIPSTIAAETGVSSVSSDTPKPNWLSARRERSRRAAPEPAPSSSVPRFVSPASIGAPSSRTAPGTPDGPSARGAPISPTLGNAAPHKRSSNSGGHEEKIRTPGTRPLTAAEILLARRRGRLP